MLQKKLKERKLSDRVSQLHLKPPISAFSDGLTRSVPLGDDTVGGNVTDSISAQFSASAR